MAPLTFAGLHADLPLRGFYRVGRYMPVAISADQADADSDPITISADGALSTVISARLSNQPRIVPLLVTSSSLARIRISTNAGRYDDQTNLHPLSLNERLVGMTAHGESIANALFPGERVVPVQLDPTVPLQDGPMAWQALDAVVVEGPWPGGLHLDDIPDLLAGGTAVGVRTLERPDSPYPWERVADGWVLRPRLAGPTGCDGDEDAYLPVGGWHPDLPADVRWQVAFAGVLFALIAGSCLLLRGHRAIGALIAISILTCAAVILWRRERPPAFEATGTVVVDAGPWVQSDDWRFVTAAEPMLARVPCDGMTWPVFADVLQALHSHATLRLTERIWTCEVGPEERMAFVRRHLLPSATDAAFPTATAQAPMSEMARQIYAGAGATITAEPAPTSASDDPSPRWSTVYVRNGADQK